MFDSCADRRGGLALAKLRAQALQVCAGCPALAACRDWVDSLEPDRRPRGVVGGQIVRYTYRRFI